MDMGGGSALVVVKPDHILAEYYWIFAGGVIAIATLINLKEYVEYKLRYVTEARGCITILSCGE